MSPGPLANTLPTKPMSRLEPHIYYLSKNIINGLNSCNYYLYLYSCIPCNPLKLVDQFIYLGNNISSTESNVNIGIVKAWTTVDKLLII